MDLVTLMQQAAKLEADLKALNLGPNSSEEDIAKAESITAEKTRVARLIALAKANDQKRSEDAKGTKDSPSEQDRDALNRTGQHSSYAPPAQATEKEEPGINFARGVRALVIGNGNIDVARTWAAETFGERHPVAMELGAALQTNDLSGAGQFVPGRLSAELIPLLTPRTVMRRISRFMPLVGGTDNIPTVEKGINAHYVGEGEDPVIEEPQFGVMSVKERELASLCPISNKLLRLASVPVDMYVRDMMLDGFVQAEDTAFYRGAGTGPAPKGLRFHVPAQHIFKANATISVANIEGDLGKLELSLSMASVPMIKPCWLMHDRVFIFLRDLRDSDGKVFPSMSQPTPTLRGYPVERYNKIPTNLGMSGTETEVVFGDFAFSHVAESYQIRVDGSTQASYKVGNEMKSAFSLNQTLIRGMAAHDYGVSRKNAFALLTGIQWGAAMQLND